MLHPETEGMTSKTAIQRVEPKSSSCPSSKKWISFSPRANNVRFEVYVVQKDKPTSHSQLPLFILSWKNLLSPIQLFSHASVSHTVENDKPHTLSQYMSLCAAKPNMSMIEVTLH